MERALSRLSLGRGGPRDLAAVRDALIEAAALRQKLESPPKLGALPAALAETVRNLGHQAELVDRLTPALAEELPLIARDGGFIAPRYEPELDELRMLRDASRRLIVDLESRYRGETGISALKIRHNNVLGYYIETTATHADKLLKDAARFIHRQTMASAMRFTTVELGDLEQRIATAADKALAIELALFADLVGEVTARAEAIALAAGALATLDVAAALAELAVEGRYCRPLVDGSTAFDIEAGRHPVVEQALQRNASGSFVANDCDLSESQRLWLVTGPNMAGKSTFLRQNALIVLLAQMGSFVPAGLGPYRRRRPPVQPRRRRRRSGPRPLHLHGGDGGDGGDPEPGDRPLPGDPGRDRPRHRHLRRPLHRLGGAGASARDQPLPRAVRHALS